MESSTRHCQPYMSHQRRDSVMQAMKPWVLNRIQLAMVPWLSGCLGALSQQISLWQSPYLVGTLLALMGRRYMLMDITVRTLCSSILLEGFSYASYEAMGFEPNAISYGPLVERVLRCFEPADFSVAVTIFGGHSACSYGKKVHVDGYNCEDLVQQHLTGGGLLFYQSFSRSVVERACSPRSILHYWEAKEYAEQNKGMEDEMVFF
ncbi:hypothetical protein HPP92_017974 [Vanilla planifolia]|uniref:Uncharacterized protein n=1 Tax=Vanilla planifolia TaxID=51239 RepID=A0A835QD74_VANPL|nr:hypothetical protein HPP92_017974 [Vanilla planifolia]